MCGGACCSRLWNVSPYTCWLMALVNGLYFCVQFGFSNLDIERDAQNVYRALDTSEEDFSAVGELVEEAKLLIRHIQLCSWRYCNILK